MTSEERKLKSEEEKQRRRDMAIETFLAKQAELGHMPTFREFKKDATINVETLIKDMGVKSFAEATITVVREVRKREGRPERIILDKKRKQEKVQGRTRKPDEERRMQVSQVSENNEASALEKEGQNMAQRIGKQRGDSYTYAEVWRFVKEYDVVNKSEKELLQLRKEIGSGPTIPTIKRKLGKRAFWKEELAVETPEEGERILKRLESGAEKAITVDVGPTAEAKPAAEEVIVLEGVKVLEPKELMAMFRDDGTIATMEQLWDTFKVSFEAVVYVSGIPVRVTLEAEK